MLSKEVVQQYFIPAQLHDSFGRFLPLPLEGKFMAEGLRRNWLKQEFSEGLIPMFSIGPIVLEDGTEGYLLRMEIVRKAGI